MLSHSTFGNLFRVTTWGESHGEALGAVVDGCPAGLSLSEELIQQYLDRRKPGQNRYTTARSESDQVQILSGVFEGRTTGTPVSLIVKNTDQRSRDYSQIAEVYRPGHADFTFDRKYGFRDYRGGGRSSGRETIGRVAAGAVASLILQELGIRLTAYTRSIGPVGIDSFDREEIFRNPLYMPDRAASEKAQEYLQECISQQDSAGGVIECLVTGLPSGIGDPVFGKLDAALSAAVMSIGGVKAVEIGDGTAVSQTTGSQNNDPFVAAEQGIIKGSNHAGGILGGMSDGSTVIVRAHVKPTPSIGRIQKTVSSSGQETDLSIRGRHDPVIVPRAVVVVEAMAAITITDLLFSNMSARMDRIKSFYK